MPETAYTWCMDGEPTCGPLSKWVRHWESAHVVDPGLVSSPAILHVPDPSLPPVTIPAELRSEETVRTDTHIIGVWITDRDRAAYRIPLDI